ncbi:unnamed protein product [Kuraishia capsulata CBS 1993]|uniref:Fatty acid desaturase domain-containing protein n=1 Tax=Kuraishia capsulata CBS 1993 TaxID=1382522 RepID=W6MPA7_9ASCO|nr:uncharacterized protein KUCA_T00004459001 [Kuraishia capsulata CBS 1993]CDK28476.1 unnamed protein product [Kuraishia capsulata CBS 1993]
MSPASAGSCSLPFCDTPIQSCPTTRRRPGAFPVVLLPPLIMSLIGKFFLHDITETHVLHHFVSRIPFYNARPVSEAIKPVLGDSYKHFNERMLGFLWKSARSCQFVDGDEIKIFKNVNGYGVKPTV